MPSPIFNSMNQGQKPQNRGMNIVQDYNKFQQNPFAFIMERRGINVPEDCRHDPEKAERADDEYGYSGKRMMISYDGHPTFDDGYSSRRDSMGRYTSRDGDDMRMHLEAAMNAAKTDQERQTIRNMMNNM